MSNKEQWEKDAKKLKEDLNNRPKEIQRNEVEIKVSDDKHLRPPRAPRPIEKDTEKETKKTLPPRSNKDKNLRGFLGI